MIKVKITQQMIQFNSDFESGKIKTSDDNLIELPESQKVLCFLCKPSSIKEEFPLYLSLVIQKLLKIF